MDAPKRLPFYITQGKAFCEAQVQEFHFLLVSFIDKSEMNRESLKKMLAQVEASVHKPVAFAFDTLSDFQRRNLIEANIPFVAASSVFYLPFLGIAYRKRKYTASQKPLEKENLPKLTAAAQAFFLFMMYNVKDAPISKSEAARMNGLTPMSVSRYCRELLDRGLIQETRERNTMQISCSAMGRALFDKALPYLISPVKKELLYLPSKAFDKMPKSGESALAQRSLLAQPKANVVACGPHAAPIGEKDIAKENRGFLPDNFVQLQVWKYDPQPLMQNNRIDTVSLYMSLKDSPNERVQACLKEMLDKEQW